MDAWICLFWFVASRFPFSKILILNFWFRGRVAATFIFLWLRPRLYQICLILAPRISDCIVTAHDHKLSYDQLREVVRLLGMEFCPS
jgi:hypothetical protein